MSKLSVTFHELTHDALVALSAEYHRLMGVATTAAPGAPGAHHHIPPAPGAQTPPPPPPTAGAASAPPPPPSAASTAPPPALAAPAATPEMQTALTAMNAFSKTHKSAGVKHVLAKCGLTKLTEANAEQLAWLTAVFQSNQLPQ